VILVLLLHFLQAMATQEQAGSEDMALRYEAQSERTKRIVDDYEEKVGNR
jgi:hypothetical protein